MIILSILLLLFAIPGAFTINATGIRMAFTYFGFSALAQTFGMHLLGLSLINLAIALANGWTGPVNLGLALAAIALFAFNLSHIRQGIELFRRAAPFAASVADAPAVNYWKAGLTPAKFGKDAVEHIPDVPYGDAGHRNQLDIFLPKERPARSMPMLIHFHGGAWVLGERNQQAQPLINYLCSQGWICFDVAYRLGPKHRFPLMITDVLRAIAWVKQHAPDYGGDPDFVALTGGSAGGHLAALAALAHDHAPFKPGFENQDTASDAAVPIYGVYDFLDRRGRQHPDFTEFLINKAMPTTPDQDRALWSDCSPISHVRPDAPPMMIIHGRHDVIAPVDNGRDFADALKETSRQEVAFVELPAGQHAFDALNSPLTVAHVRAIERFLNHAYHKKKSRTALPEKVAAE